MLEENTETNEASLCYSERPDESKSIPLQATLKACEDQMLMDTEEGSLAVTAAWRVTVQQGISAGDHEPVSGTELSSRGRVWLAGV